MFSAVMPLDYHRHPVAGKFKTVPSKPLENPGHLALAYSPGVADACQAIAKDPRKANEYTIRQTLVAVISNGTAVLGLGNIGPLAAKPVMEGKAVLFQKFGRLNAIDLEIDERDPQKFIDIVASLAPSFGGVNLEDIKAPECFVIEEALQERLSIPVFHDDQHGTAITVAACLTNALDIVGKAFTTSKCVVLGAGAGALACINLLLELGLRKENLFVFDSQGLIWEGRPGLEPHKKAYAQREKCHLNESFQGADIFLGLSGPDCIKAEAISTMAPKPIVFTLANPVPEIYPHEVLAVQPEALIGTGRSDYPNQVNNLLCFPYIFRAALDAGAPRINAQMKKACVDALSKIAKEGFSDVLGYYEGQNAEFSHHYFIPKPFDPRLLTELPVAVAKAAIDSGLAPSFCLRTYRKTLVHQAYEKLPAFRRALLSCHPQAHLPVIFYEAGSTLSPEVLSAAQALKRYGLAQPGFLGDAHALRPILKGYPLLEDSPLKAFSDLTPEELCVRTTPIGEGLILEGYEKEGSACFFLRGGGAPLIEAVKLIERLGWKPYLIGSQASSPLENCPVYSSLPSSLQEGVGYLRLEATFHEAPSIGPFWIGANPFWHYLPPGSSLKETLECFSLALLRKAHA